MGGSRRTGNTTTNETHQHVHYHNETTNNTNNLSNSGASNTFNSGVASPQAQSFFSDYNINNMEPLHAANMSEEMREKMLLNGQHHIEKILESVKPQLHSISEATNDIQKKIDSKNDDE